MFFTDEPKGAKAGKSSKNKNKESKEQTVYTVASKQLLISLAPPVLTLHLKRFQQARFTLQKLTKHVDFPLELNLAPFCSRSGRVSKLCLMCFNKRRMTLANTRRFSVQCTANEWIADSSFACRCKPLFLVSFLLSHKCLPRVLKWPEVPE